MEKPWQMEFVNAGNKTETAFMFARCFPRNEPIMRGAGIGEQELIPYSQIWCNESCDDGISRVAVDGNGQIIGAVLVRDFMKPLPEGFDKISTKFGPVYAAIDHVECVFKNSHPELQEGDAVDMWYGAIDPAWRSQGILSAILKQQLDDIVHRSSYKYIVADPTNDYSLAALQKGVPFDIVTELKYEDFTITKDGQAIKPLFNPDQGALPHGTTLRFIAYEIERGKS